VLAYVARTLRPAKAKVGKKAAPAKKAPRGAKKGGSVRHGSKAAQILDLLKRPGGVTVERVDGGHRLVASLHPRLPVR